MSVAASIWVLAFAQRHWDRAGKIARAMGRAAHAAFMFQGLPLIVAAGGIAGSFALGWTLVTHASGPDHAGLRSGALAPAAIVAVYRWTQSCCYRFRESIATPSRLAIRQMERASHSGRCLSSARTMRSSNRPSGR